MGGGQKESGIWQDMLEEMLTRPRFAQKAAQFMKSLGLIDRFKSATFD